MKKLPSNQTVAPALVLGLFSSLGFAQNQNQSLDVGASPIIEVDQAKDSLDGVCSRDVAEKGRCNLRAAVAEALKSDGAVINLLVDSDIDQGTIAINPALPTQSPLRIQSSTSEIRKIAGNGSTRLFDIDQNARVQIVGLYITQFTSWDAGAIVNRGDLVMENTTFFANRVACFGTGAMTAYATCSGGAISNGGTLTLKNGSRFEKNEVIARASTASYTTSQGTGGAIASGGKIIFDGDVVFESNLALSEATSGFHPMPNGGATANALGGAIYSANGNLEIQEDAVGKCVFSNNIADANASTPYGEASFISQGGAIYVSDSEFQVLAESCRFVNNKAGQDEDLAFVPTTVQ